MKRTIAFFITELEIGGAEKQLLLLGPHLAQYFDLHIICALKPTTLGQQLLPQGLTVHYLNGRNQLDPRLPFRLWQLLKKLKPHTLVTFLFYADILGRLLAFPSIKVISSQRSSYFRRPYLRWLNHFTSFLVTRYVVQSRAALQNFPQATVIPNAVALPVPKTHYPASPQRIICVANLKAGKGHHLLLSAFAHLHTPRLLLLLAGTGPLQPHLAAQAQHLGISSRLRFLGQRHDIPQLLQKSDIFVLPTEAEGMSNALLEAMACGLPCLTSDLPVNQELIQPEHTGLLFAKKDLESLTKALRRLCEEESLRKRLGHNARQYIQNHHSPAKIIHLWQQLLST
jgi:glycosyltransferase involved in cell wall biosynthesis